MRVENNENLFKTIIVKPKLNDKCMADSFLKNKQ